MAVGGESHSAAEFERLTLDLDEARGQLAATDEVLAAVGRTTSNLGSVLATVVESARRLCHADVAQIHLLEGDEYRLAAAVGLTEEYRDFIDHNPIALDRRSLIGRVGLDLRPQQIKDVLADPDYERHDVQRIGGFRTILGVPMVLDGELIGILSAWRTQVEPFPDRAADVLSAFAAQAAIAIRNVDLVQALKVRQEELARKVDHLEALGDIGQAVSSSLDPDQVLAAIIMHAVHLSDADGGSIFEYDDVSESFRVRAQYGTSQEVLRALRRVPIGIHETLIGQAAMQHKSQQVGDIREVPPDPHLRVLVEAGWRSLIAVPILRDEQIVGALTVRRRRPGLFPEDVCDLLETFAGQSALAIVNARLFRELEQRGAQLEVASRHKSEFLASMSHELRTPLNAVIGFSEVLLERMFGDLNERQEEYVRDIWESGRHLLELLNDILDLSKVEAGRMELERTSFAIGEALEYCATMVRERAAQRGVEVCLDIGDAVDVLTADELRFKQVVLNLLSNAIKFTRTRVDLVARSDGMTLSVSVIDDGPGVAPEDRERIFESFQQGGRGAPKEEGTGLGLTLSRRIVELHGGRLGVESELGVGSTFSFTVPLAAGPRDTPPEPGSRSSAVPTVVIVEDDRRSLDLLSLYVEHAGAEVVAARDGQAGLELIRRLHPAAVVLDIRLPELDGWDLLALVKADPDTASIPVVVVSMVDERGKGFALGAAEYLVKPASRDEVRAALARVGALPGAESTVVCIEDDPRVRDLIRSTLEPEGWTVLAVADVEEGLDLTRSNPPAVVLLDLLIAGTDGFAVAETIRQDPSTADVPIILLTSGAMAPEVKEHLQGQIAYVADQGQFDPGALIELVHRATAALEPR